MTVDEMFSTVLAMVWDREFDPDGTILPWLTHQADRDPMTLALVVMRLASCCPLEVDEQIRNQCAVLRERGTSDAVPRRCDRCSGWMVNREYAQPDLLVHNAGGLCRTCYSAAKREAA